MPQKVGNAGHGMENYDPETGKYVKSETGNVSEGEIPSFFKKKEDTTDIFSSNETYSLESLKSEIDAYKQFYKIEGEHEVEDDATSTNYRDNPYYRNNCTHCAIAYELRRRGYDVEALPCENGPIGYDRFARGGWRNNAVIDLYTNEKYSADYGGWKPFPSRKAKISEHLYNEMIKEGEGARFFIRFSWSGRSGHAMNAEVRNGTVIVVDSQTDSTMDLGTWQRSIFDEQYSNICKPSECCFIRVDNKRLNMRDINIAVKNKRR